MGVYTTAESGTNTSYAIRAIDKKTTSIYYATATGATENGLFSLDCAPVDSNNFAVVFSNGNSQLKLIGYYQVGATISNNFSGESSGLAVDTTCNISLCYIEDGKLLCSYRNKNTNNMEGIYITVSGTTVAWSEPFILNSASGENKLIGLNGAYLSSVINNGLNLSVKGEITTYEYVDCVEKADDDIDGVTKTECTVDNAGQVYFLDPFSQYTQYDYIASDGTAWIDTGVEASADIKVEAQASMANAASENLYLASAYSGTKVNEYSLWINNGSWLTVGYGNQASTYSGDSIWVENDAKYDGRPTFTFDGGKLYLNDTQIASVSNGTFAGTSENIYIFCRHNGSSVDRIPTIGRVGNAKIYDNDTLVRDFVPCTNPQGVAGLYDKVSQTFFGPANGGTFTAGNDA